MMTQVRGVRGATTVEVDDQEQIHAATRELCIALLEQNDIQTTDIASCIVTMTPDLHSTFPASALRDLAGWDQVPLLCAQEIDVTGAMPRCLRLLLHVNTTKTQAEIHHVYLNRAEALRPDLVQK